MIVQDASGYVGQSIPISVCVKLLGTYGNQKILFKPEAAPNGPTLSALRDATGGHARLFEGSGGVFLIDSFRRGIAGTMPGLDLLDGIVRIWRALKSGDDAAAIGFIFPSASVALELQAGLDGFLAIEKHLMMKRGLFPLHADADRMAGNSMRRPLKKWIDCSTIFAVLCVKGKPTIRRFPCDTFCSASFV
ncbi:MAG: hypothetical protein U0744_08870 [Gemmataceae bacterium]